MKLHRDAGLLIILGTFLLSLVGCTNQASQSSEDLKEKYRASPTDIVGVPTILSISPNRGSVYGGYVIRVTGENFSAKTKVYFGNLVLKNFSEGYLAKLISATEMYIAVPSYFTGNADLIIINDNKPEAASLAPVKFTYFDPPQATPDPAPVAQPGDTIGLFTSENNGYKLLPSNSESAMNIRFQAGFARTGFVGPTPVAGSFDGRPGDTVGFYDTRLNTFHLFTENGSQDGAQLKFKFGSGKVIALTGDWNGDGTDTIGVYNPFTGAVQLRNTNSEGPADIEYTLGGSTLGLYGAFAGDWDGDGTDTLGLYDFNARTITLKNAPGTPDTVYEEGAVNQFFVAGDWDGDGKDSISIYDIYSHSLYIKNTRAAGPAEKVISFANGSFSPLPNAGRWRQPLAIDMSPGYAWQTGTPESQRINRSLLDLATLRFALLPNSRSLLVVRNGVLVREAYLHGHRAEATINVMSVSKSILSALYGIAWKENIVPDFNRPISLDLPADYFTDGDDPRKKQITYANLLTMSGGLMWNEDSSDFMTNWIMSPTLAKWPLEQPMVSTPGTAWNYSTGLTHLAARLLATKTTPDLYDFAKVKLFDKMGVKLGRWDHDAEGFKNGGSNMYLKARDMARFGQMYLNNGVLDGQQIVDPLWVKITTATLFQTGLPGRGYGGWWWTETMGGHPGYFALGFGGQYIAVFPTLKLVVVTQCKSDVSVNTEHTNSGQVSAMIRDQIIPAVAP
ncbi:MAG: serine hydrolase [Bdellovibrionia bacterium]